MRKQGFLTWERARRYSMPVNETETCIAVMRGMLTVCGLCETEKAAEVITDKLRKWVRKNDTVHS
jgi:hypothetical protein